MTISLVPRYLVECQQTLSLLNLAIANDILHAINRRLGWILTQPHNYALAAAALDPYVMLHELVSQEINNDVWSGWYSAHRSTVT